MARKGLRRPGGGGAASDLAARQNGRFQRNAPAPTGQDRRTPQLHPAGRIVLQAARAIASGQTWAGLKLLCDLLEGQPGVDPAELTGLRRWALPPGSRRRPEQRRPDEWPRSPSGGGAAA